MIKGIIIEMGGKEWTVPPLTIGQLRELAPELARFKLDTLFLTEEGVNVEAVDAIIKIAHAALQRNYPDLSEDALVDLIDLGVMGEVAQAVFTGTGLKRSIGVGEANAASGGPSSTASSPPASVTASLPLTH